MASKATVLKRVDIERCLQEGLAIIRENTSCVALPVESSAICKYEMPRVINEFGPAPKPLGVTMCFVPMQNCTKATLVDPDKRTYHCPNGYAPKQRVKSNEEARGYGWVSAIQCER